MNILKGRIVQIFTQLSIKYINSTVHPGHLRGTTLKNSPLTLLKKLGMAVVNIPANAFCSNGERWYLRRERSCQVNNGVHGKVRRRGITLWRRGCPRRPWAAAPRSPLPIGSPTSSSWTTFWRCPTTTTTYDALSEPYTGKYGFHNIGCTGASMGLQILHIWVILLVQKSLIFTSFRLRKKYLCTKKTSLYRKFQY